jgi:uncharacterized protein (TIGR00730 family)
MMTSLNALCVFCGSSPGGSQLYRDGTAAFGAELGRRGVDLVWGGSHVGLMGVLADAVLAAGRRAIGVIPSFMLDRELAHPRASELIVVDSMHSRKATMAARADGFVLLPGGLGSFEEFFEVYTWAQIGLHRKPIGVLNLGGYFNPLFELLRHGAREGFMPKTSLDLVQSADEPFALLEKLARSHLAARASNDALDKT